MDDGAPLPVAHTLPVAPTTADGGCPILPHHNPPLRHVTRVLRVKQWFSKATIGPVCRNEPDSRRSSVFSG